MAINPVFIHPNTYPASQYLPFGDIGAFPHNTDLWIVGSEEQSNSGPLNLVASKSTDGGNTWARIIAGPNMLASDMGSASWKGSGTKVIVSYRTAGGAGNVKAIVFDMATATFGAPFAIPFEPSLDGSYLAAVLVELASGNLAFCWQEETAFNVFSISVAIYNGVTWSSRLNVGVSTVNKRLREIVVDGSDRVGLFWQSGTTFAAPNVYSLTSGTTLVSETAMYNGRLVGVRALNFQNIGLYDAATDSVVFAVQRFTSDPNPPFDDLNNISVVIGTPTATPVFSVVDIYTLDETGTNLYLDFPWITKSGTEYSVIWGHGNNFGLYASGTFQLYQSIATTLAGPWTAPTTIFDIHVNHFPTDPFTSNLETLWVNILSNGTINIVVGMVQIIAGSDQWCGVLGFFSLAPVPGITLTFNLKGGLPAGLELVLIQPPPPGPPGPVVNPTVCVEQT